MMATDLHKDPLPVDGPWEGARVGVLGLGRSGCAAVRLLRRNGARVVAFDDRAEAELNEEATRLVDLDVALHLGGDADAIVQLQGLDALVVSPGVGPSHALLREAEASGLVTLGELELAMRRVRVPVVAVTGTNGKSTTVSLVHAMLLAGGRSSRLAGNIGVPLCDEVEELSADGILVVEASSFQLERIQNFHPQVAAVLNVAPDHLNRYRDFEDYAEAKRNILVNLDAQDTYVFPADDIRLHSWAENTPAVPRAFGLKPRTDVDLGAWVEEGALVRAGEDGKEPVLPLSQMSLIGEHNVLNALAAICITQALGLESAPMAEALRSFHSLPHRAVVVPTRDGTRWINDSKATNVHAASATLAGLSGPVVLLLGGSGKGEDYAPLARWADRVKVALCYGDEGPRIADALQSEMQVERRASMREAMERAGEVARPGDTVLLSPACASFDEFKGFEQRGAVFESWVQEYRSTDRPNEGREAE